MSASLTRLCTVEASTKRAPAITGVGSAGVRGAAATHLTEVLCMPLDPVDPQLRQRLGLQTPHELLQTFVPGTPDILPGDYLVVNGREYPVRSAAEWSAGVSGKGAYVHLVVEDLQR